MPGAPDPLYVAARHALLDALGALRAHLESIVLVGAQAVYLHAGEADIAVAPFTTDGDLAIDPRHLASRPLLELALHGANFLHEVDKVGVWTLAIEVEGTIRTVSVDLLIPESLSGPGRRAARIPPHANTAARRVDGLEGVLVDRDTTILGALDARDSRQFELSVAGPSALLVAKVHKILDRVGSPDRLSDKDALDVYRLLRAVPTAALVGRFEVLLADELSRGVTERALGEIPRLFGSPSADGTQMAVRSAGPLESGYTIAASIAVLAQELIAELGLGRAKASTS